MTRYSVRETAGRMARQEKAVMEAIVRVKGQSTGQSRLGKYVTIMQKIWP